MEERTEDQETLIGGIIIVPAGDKEEASALETSQLSLHPSMIDSSIVNTDLTLQHVNEKEEEEIDSLAKKIKDCKDLSTQAIEKAVVSQNFSGIIRSGYKGTPPESKSKVSRNIPDHDVRSNFHNKDLSSTKNSGGRPNENDPFLKIGKRLFDSQQSDNGCMQEMIRANSQIPTNQSYELVESNFDTNLTVKRIIFRGVWSSLILSLCCIFFLFMVKLNFSYELNEILNKSARQQINSEISSEPVEVDYKTDGEWIQAKTELDSCVEKLQLYARDSCFSERHLWYKDKLKFLLDHNFDCQEIELFFQTMIHIGLLMIILFGVGLVIFIALRILNWAFIFFKKVCSIQEGGNSSLPGRVTVFPLARTKREISSKQKHPVVMNSIDSGNIVISRFKAFIARKNGSPVEVTRSIRILSASPEKKFKMQVNT